MKTYYILTYKAKANFSEEKKPYQAEHKLLMEKAYNNNNLILAGGVLNPADGGMLIFNNEEIAESFAINDPYVKSGIIEKWSIRPWKIVIG